MVKDDLGILTRAVVCKIAETKLGKKINLDVLIEDMTGKAFAASYPHGNNEFARIAVERLGGNAARIFMEIYAHGSLPVKRGIYNLTKSGREQRAKFKEEHGFVPFTAVLNPTNRCNVNCSAKCYIASPYVGEKRRFKPHDWKAEELDMLVTQCKELGIRFFTLSGGEPLLVWEEIRDIFSSHRDCCAIMFTNGTLLDDRVADELAELGTIFPGISVEGTKKYTDMMREHGIYDKAKEAIERCKDRRIFFGISTTPTNFNIDNLTSDDFRRYYFDEWNARFIYYFACMPIGIKSDMSNALGNEQRLKLVEHAFDRIFSGDEMLHLDFWNFGAMVDGCMAYGHNYFNLSPPHIAREKIDEHVRKFRYKAEDVLTSVMPCVFLQGIAGFVMRDGKVLGKKEKYDDLFNFIVYDESMRKPREDWLEKRKAMVSDYSKHYFGLAPCRFYDNPDDLLKQKDLMIAFQDTFKVHEEPLLSEVSRNAISWNSYARENYVRMVVRLNRKHNLGLDDYIGNLCRNSVH